MHQENIQICYGELFIGIHLNESILLKKKTLYIVAIHTYTMYRDGISKRLIHVASYATISAKCTYKIHPVYRTVALNTN